MRARGAGLGVGPGVFVRLGYAVFDADGERVDTAGDELTAVHGYGQLLPDLERAIDGLGTGAELTVQVAPAGAFGERRSEAVLELDRDEFPPDVAPGDRFEVENDEGGILVLQVLEVTDDAVVVDSNHPLAGQRLRYELSIKEARPATAEELEAAVHALEAPEGGPGAEAAGAPSPGPELLPVERLLRRG